MSEKLDALPEGWLAISLIQICDIAMGQSPSSSVINNKGNGLPFYQGKTEFTDVYPIKKRFCDEPVRIAEIDDILMSVRAPVGPVNIANERSGFGRGICAIACGVGVEHKYIFYQLKGLEKYIASLGTGTTFTSINRNDVESLPINLAPEKEQTRIVEKLEELLSDLDNGVAELKASQNKLTQYRQSLLKSAVEGTLTQEWREQNQHTVSETGEQLLARILKERRQRWQQQKLAEFKAKDKKPPKDWQKKYPEPVQPDTSELPELPEGWIWASLSSIADLIQIGPFGSLLHKHDYITDGIPLINPTHIKDQKIEPNYNLSVGPIKMTELQNFVMKTDDIVIGRRGEMGRCAVVTDIENGWLCGTGSLFIRLTKGMNPYFYSWILSSKRVKDYLSEVSVGTTMQNLNQKILHSVPVPLCISDEQFEISNQLEVEYGRIDNQLNDLVSAFKSTETQRKNILKDAFSGKLVEQDPNDEPASVLLEKIKAERALRAKQPKPKKSKKKANKKANLMDTLENVLKNKNDWMDAQEAFTACGVTNGTDTDRIEALYAELRILDKAGRLDCERHGNYDMIKLKEE